MCLFDRASDVIQIKSNLLLYSGNCICPEKFGANGGYISSLHLAYWFQWMLNLWSNNTEYMWETVEIFY